ncbi:nucleolar complex protein 2 [Phakopsora pachyrhizi]|uniref:Nucleolar complex protein 2 n=1 Tax=Phakopsora pachyrhizi TaxID=170000 RepID=A0AAV0B152_PHAPC|nr:nucleolar complex protein 2 [Phakopsora pachyrhizi]
MPGKRVTKQTKKFNKNHLNHTLTSRKKQQAKKKEIENRKHLKGQKSRQVAQVGKGGDRKDQNRLAVDDDDDDDDSVAEQQPRIDMSVDALLSAKGLQSDDDENEDKNSSDENDDDDDLNSLLSIDDGSDIGMDLKDLKEKDPEFYSYLEKNDRELLNFDANNLEDSDTEDSSVGNGSTSVEPTTKSESGGDLRQVLLTKEMIKTWKKAILETRSMRALRKLLLAFKSAAFGADDSAEDLPYIIESSAVFDSVVTATLKFLPMFLNQVSPAKELPSGKFKLERHTKLYSFVQRILKSYFASLGKLISQIPSRSQEDKSMEKQSLLHTAVSESAKLTPWIIGNSKIVQNWIKVLLELWGSSADQIRVAAILALRKLSLASKSSVSEYILKGLYTNLVRSSNHTTNFTLPTINLMKNSASEIYLLNQEISYPLLYNFIRQLAIHLRNSMKLKNKDGFQAVYNWQFIHSLDFWSLVLSSACNSESEPALKNSPLQPMIYPLVQITTGVIKLIPTSRYYPLRFHCVRILLRLVQKTGTFIPLAPFLLDVVDSPLFKRRSKPSSLKALDFEYLIRCPKSHEHLQLYADGIAEECVFLLLEYYSTCSKSIAFPELVLPAIVMLKRIGKHSKSPRLVTQVKGLVEKLEANKVWIETRRAKVSFGPRSRMEVDKFLVDVEATKTPLGGYYRLQSKVRGQKRAALDRSAHNEILVD